MLLLDYYGRQLKISTGKARKTKNNTRRNSLKNYLQKLH